MSRALRRRYADQSPETAMKELLDVMKRTKDNSDLLQQVLAGR